MPRKGKGSKVLTPGVPEGACVRCKKRDRVDGLPHGAPVCRHCYSDLMGLWRELHPRLQRNESHYKSKYGIGANEYGVMFAWQGGTCTICRKPYERDDRPLVVDHDHQTGRVRSLLCGTCNSGIGMLKENTRNMYEAMNYVTSSFPLGRGQELFPRAGIGPRS